MANGYVIDDRGTAHHPGRLRPADDPGRHRLSAAGVRFLVILCPPGNCADRSSSTDLRHALRHRPSLQSNVLTQCVRPHVARDEAEVQPKSRGCCVSSAALRRGAAPASAPRSACTWTSVLDSLMP